MTVQRPEQVSAFALQMKPYSVPVQSVHVVTELTS